MVGHEKCSEEINELRKEMKELRTLFNPKVKFYILPGGKLPQRSTDGAAGYDVFVRAVVYNEGYHEELPCMRRTLYDFSGHHHDPHVSNVNGRWIYLLRPQEEVLIGAGFAVGMDSPTHYDLFHRSGMVTVKRIPILNATSIVDSDYRGEAGILLRNESNIPFEISHGMRIAQVKFQIAVHPIIEEVADHTQLGSTERGARGFGSTGFGEIAFNGGG